MLFDDVNREIAEIDERLSQQSSVSVVELAAQDCRMVAAALFSSGVTNPQVPNIPTYETVLAIVATEYLLTASELHQARDLCEENVREMEY